MIYKISPTLGLTLQPPSYFQKMSKFHLLLLLLLLIQCAQLLHFTVADIGVAAQYNPPYLPTACHGNDVSQFPSSNLFAAVGEGLWDNGAACGRQYLVRCISAVVPGTCRGGTIQVKVVDRAQTSTSRPSRPGATIVLSNTAFGTIARSSASSFNMEYTQV